MKKSISPFDYINAINTKVNYDLIELHEDEYNSFLINRGMSQFMDCLFFACEMNQYAGVLDHKMQFDFYYYGIAKKKRFSKWQKSKWKSDKEYAEQVQIIMDYYGYSQLQAEEVLQIFLLSSSKNHNLLNTIKKEELDHGGRQ